MTANWRITNTALVHLEEVVKRTAFRWGYGQAVKYHSLLKIGFQEIAEHYGSFNNPHRDKLAEGTDFGLHLVEHHYVAFKVHKLQIVIITGIFHEKVNIPIHLKRLQKMTRSEIATLEDEIKASHLGAKV